MLSNFDLVTESLTLIAGNSSVPACAIWYRRWTPVVVSSETPRASAVSFANLSPSAASSRRIRSRMTPYSSESCSGSNAGTLVFENSRPLCRNRVASPPSSTIRVGPWPDGHASASAVHHQYSGSVSPFQANTGMPRGLSTVPPVSGRPTTTAAAAWSCVEKMLQETQRTSAPSRSSVSISTAVCTVMCSEPMIREPFSGWASA